MNIQDTKKDWMLKINHRIRNAKNVVVLMGAGTSACCGIPTTKKMMEGIECVVDAWKSAKTSDTKNSELIGAGIYNMPKETKDDNTEAYLDDIEAYLARIEDSKRYHERCAKDSQKQKAIEALYDKIIGKISDLTKQDVKEKTLDTHKAFLDKLISMQTG